MDTLLEVLKWIIIILLAGFIGQFGKTMSLHIINYFKKRKEKKVSIESRVVNEKNKEVIEEKARNHKAEKKALKAQLKARKKAEKAKQKN